MTDQGVSSQMGNLANLMRILVHYIGYGVLLYFWFSNDKLVNQNLAI